MKIIDDDVGWDTLNVKSDEDEEKYLVSYKFIYEEKCHSF